MLKIIAGDVKLTNLEVRETALDDFDLPIKLKFGYLSELVLKIPWKNLYQEPVIASVEGMTFNMLSIFSIMYFSLYIRPLFYVQKSDSKCLSFK